MEPRRTLSARTKRSANHCKPRLHGLPVRRGSQFAAPSCALGRALMARFTDEGLEHGQPWFWSLECWAPRRLRICSLGRRGRMLSLLFRWRSRLLWEERLLRCLSLRPPEFCNNTNTTGRQVDIFPYSSTWAPFTTFSYGVVCPHRTNHGYTSDKLRIYLLTYTSDHQPTQSHTGVYLLH